MFDYENFRVKLRERRHSLSLTIEQLAEKAELDENNLTKIELGMHKPSLITIVSIVNAFNTDLSTFLDNSDFQEKDLIINNVINTIKACSDKEKQIFYKITQTL